MSDSRSAAAPKLGCRSLTSLLGLMHDGVVVVDRERRLVYINGVASHRLQLDASVLTGARSLALPESSDTVEVELEVAGKPYIAIVFHEDGQTMALEQRRLAAFARVAGRAVGSESLQSTLDAVAEEALHGTAAVSCTIIVTDHESGEISAVGAAGTPRDHLARVQDAMRRAAPLRTLAVAQRRVPLVERDLPALVRDDERFAPLEPIVESGHWSSLVAVPLVVRDRTFGALTTYYPDPADPDEAEVAFLGAMADQTAIAVNTARLFAEAEAKAILDERNRLARDLHDSVSQNLYSLILQMKALQSAATRICDADSEMIRTRLQPMHALAEAALEDIRSAIIHLRAPQTADTSGLAVAVREHAAMVAEREGVEVTVSTPDTPLLLSLGAEHELFRLVTEALANSVRHGHPDRVDIELAEPSDRNDLMVTITDNGCGFDVDAAHARLGHVGLLSMRERTERLGGHFTVSSSGKGTTVHAVVPYRRWHTPGATR